VLHPTSGRFEPPPRHVIPLGRSVIAPANHSLANIVLSPVAVRRLERTLERERFDLLHLHEPLTPALCVAALARATCPIVATFHAAGHSRWRASGRLLWGFLLERIDARIAVSEVAASTARTYLPGAYRLIPNGVRLPRSIATDARGQQALFVGRHEPRKGLSVLVRAWPSVHRRTGARLRVAGADPLAVRRLLGRERVSESCVDVLGPVTSDRLDEELARAKLLVAPSLGRESFGMVLTRAFACALPAIASDIPGYREVLDPSASVAVVPGDVDALVDAVEAIVADEGARKRMGSAAREIAVERYAWPTIARRLERIYESLAGRELREAA
jgi:phosphatidylinositol alpha-mannosyltransferase